MKPEQFLTEATNKIAKFFKNFSLEGADTKAASIAKDFADDVNSLPDSVDAE